MSGILWNLLFFLIALGILIAVHEFGHFWVARRCGVKVERFSIGFGKALFERTGKDGTQYSIALIPLGGYVKMLDTRVDDVPAELINQTFDKKPLPQRAAIVAAGPIANFLFAIVAYWLVLMIGIPALKPVIGEVAPNSIAAEAGLERGMELVEVAGVKTPDWHSVNLQFMGHIGDTSMPLGIKPFDGANYQIDKTLDLRAWTFDPEKQSSLTTLGLTPFTPDVTTRIAQVIADSAAQAAGIQVGDKIQAINDAPMASWQEIVDVVQRNPAVPLEVQLTRDNQPIELTLTPKVMDHDEGKIGYAGFAPVSEPWPESYRFNYQYGPLEAIPAALSRTWEMVVLTASMIKKLFVGDIAVKNLSGPISIAKGAGTTADYGIAYFLSFLALISVNLGIMNLLPLPVLDGGHLLFFGIEAVRRRPVSERVQEIGFRVGSAIIAVLMVVAIFNDIARL